MEGRARVRALLALATWLALGALWPGFGDDYVNLRRANLVLSLAAAGLVLARHRGFVRDARRELAALAALGAVTLAVYTNMFTFRVHYHDLAHYYLGSKYFRELHYATLYTAMLRGEAELHGGALPAPEARDLAGRGDLVPAGKLLARSQPVRDAFTPERWLAFKADLEFLHGCLGQEYAMVLRDHGFNASPLWPVVGGTLARLVPAGSAWGIRSLALLDPLLLALTFAAIARTFGARAALLALIHFCLVYGATFEWVGGAFLRYLWFSATALALCAWQRGRAVLGGALLGCAATLRVFPALFLAAVALGATAEFLRARRPPRAAARAVAGFVLAATALVVLTALVPPGLEAWVLFAENISRHARAPMANLIGLGPALAALVGWDPDTLGTLRALQLAVAAPAVAVAVALAARQRPLPGAAVLGIPLIFAGLSLTAYYYAFLVFLTLAERDRPLVVAGAFALEAITYALSLIEGSTAVLYAHRSLLILALLVAAYLRPVRAGLRRTAAPTAG
jgi:hypothetical protein